MQRRHRTIFLVAIALAVGACKNKQEIHSAKNSVYDADFAIVFSAAVEATRSLYANLDDNPGSGLIKTAWHQVSYASNQDDLANPRTVSQTPGMTGAGLTPGAAAGTPTRLAYKRHFIRFEVSVVGGRPWRVKVVGQAAEWDPGNALPTPLRGAAKPPWLDGRTEALQVAIYRKIRAYARPMVGEVEVSSDEPQLPRTDPSTFKDVPKPAAEQLAAIKDALARRDYATLRGLVADDVVWSLGGAPSADTALVMWQADPATLDTMAGLIEGGCGAAATSPSASPTTAAAGKRVSCPAGAPVTGKWQLLLEPRGQTWKIASFVQAE